MIELAFSMVRVTSTIRPLADVPALEIGAGRQDHVGERYFAFVPYRLVDDEFEVLRAVGNGETVRVHRSAKMRPTILVHHADGRMAGRGICELCKLAFQRARISRVTFGLAIDDRLGNSQAGDALCHRVHADQMRHALVEADGNGAAFDVAGEPTLGVAREVEVEVDRRASLQKA